MKTKPGLKVLIFYSLGLLAGRYFDPPVAPILFVCLVPAVFASICWLVDKGHPVFRTMCLGSALAILGIVRYELTAGYFPPDHVSRFTNHDDLLVVRGMVIRYPERRLAKLNLIVASHEIYFDQKVRPIHGNILLSLIELDTTFQYGDELVVRGKLRKPKDRRNPGEFDYREYLLAQGIHGIISVNNVYQIKRVSTGNGNWFLRELVYPTKEYLEYFTRNSFPQQEAALLSGLLIGERGEISRELSDAFSKLGVIHILAVSGSHVAFIILIFMGVIGFLRLPYWLQVWLTIFAIIFYAYLTNLNPPVVRSSIMGALLLLATLLERKTDIYNTLAISALFILVFNPLELFQAGFQLSFFAVVTIVYFYPRLKKLGRVQHLYNRFKKYAVVHHSLDLLLVSAAAFLGTLPLTIFYFNRIPNFSLPANLLVVPLSFVGLASGLAAAVFGLFMPVVGKLYLAATWFFLHVMIKFVEWASQLPLAQFEVYRFSTGAAVCYFVGLFLLFNFQRPVARRWLIIYGLVLANLLIWKHYGQIQNDLRVMFLDVGQGDAALIRFPNGKNMLIDGGPRGSHSDAGAWVIAPYLRREGIHQIDALVLSHTDADHLGGFPHVMRNFKVREIWDNGQMQDTQLCREYLALIDSLRIIRRVLRAGAVVDDFAPAKIFILHPTDKFIQDNPAKLNDASLSLKLCYGEMDFIFMGDVEEAGEQAIPKLGELLQSEVLKVSHHGSRTSSRQQILDYVHPEVAVISVGEQNKFGHPDVEVMARLSAMKTQVLRTDRDAAVIFETDGRTLKLARWKSAGNPELKP